MKRSSDFHFKQFTIGHDRSTHKVGTDAVVLGAWVDVNQVKQILDIGTGSGIIALMLAQRTGDHVLIDAVEVQQADAEQASENIARSPWAKRITVHHVPVQQFRSGEKYDLIVTNPPYFTNSWLPPKSSRSTARHTLDLGFHEILEAAENLLCDHGCLALILPYEEGLQFIRAASTKGFFPRRRLEMKSREHKSVERLVLEFCRTEVQTIAESLILHAEGNDWSEGYKNLTREFYFKI